MNCVNNIVTIQTCCEINLRCIRSKMRDVCVSCQLTSSTFSEMNWKKHEKSTVIFYSHYNTILVFHFDKTFQFQVIYVIHLRWTSWQYILLSNGNCGFLFEKEISILVVMRNWKVLSRLRNHLKSINGGMRTVRFETKRLQQIFTH